MSIRTMNQNIPNHKCMITEVVLCFCLSGFGEIKLNQKMKDYLAENLEFVQWKKILKVNLPEKADKLVAEIQKDYQSDYDRSYAVVRKLVEIGKAGNASQMENILKENDQIFANRFRNKFLECW